MPMIIIPTLAWHFGGILGLLLAWRHHRQKLQAGLITPVDLLNPSGIYWYLYVVPDDPDVCSSCRDAHGTIFLAHAVTHPGFTPPAARCSTHEKCLGVFLSFSNGWLEANDLVAKLRAAKAESRRLSQNELNQLVAIEWQNEVGQLDRAGIHLLSGFLRERSLPLQAIRSYGAVLEQATLPRDQSLLMSAYMRLAGLLARRGNPRKAIQVIEHFEKRVARADAGTFTPTGKQRRALSTMKPYLYALVDQGTDSRSKPATIDRSGKDRNVAPISDISTTRGQRR